MRGVDKLTAAAVALEKLDQGMDHHGDRLVGRIVTASDRLDEVAARGHRKLDERDNAIDAMEKAIDRLDSALGGNGDPTKRPSTALLTGGDVSKPAPDVGSKGGVDEASGMTSRSTGTLNSGSGGM